ncbi:alpha/beta fold hydrolase [Natrialbaceae archaeon GCM10025810]|uniref:alpha/beta fold hydrolase n=1 Tax=Halovalidus salilacus TaxID=3075124 RepID=UPI003620F2D6
MPTASNGSVSLYYEVDGGAGEPGGGGDHPETVAFVTEAGLGGWSWGWQYEHLAGPFRTVVWDPRGTGRSDAPSEPADLETLVSDLEAVLRDCGVRNAHLVGAGLGGAVALEAARTTNRAKTLTLFGAAPRAGAFDLEALYAPPDDREALRESLESALSPEFRAEQPEVVDGIVDWRADGDALPEGWETQVAALEGWDARRRLVEVTQPSLVFHGTADEIVPAEAGRELAFGLPRGEFVPLEGAGHLCFVERSRAVNDRLFGFLEEHAGD